MRVLVLGASGTVGRRLVADLTRRGVDVRRGGRGPDADARFDWSDPTTHPAALAGVEAVHVIAPAGVADPAPVVLPFLALAADAGVRRATLQSSSAIPLRGQGLGLVGARLREFVPAATVLRPTWFASNLTGEHAHADSVRAHDEVVTATGTGRIPFIDPADIAAVAATILTGSGEAPTDLVLTGPRPVSFDEAAAALTVFTGREIVHRNVSEDELADRWTGIGVPAEFAALLAAMDTAIAAGSEDRTTTAVSDVLGRPARTLEEFLASCPPGCLDRLPGPAPTPEPGPW